MAVRRMAQALLPLAWVNSSLSTYGCMPYGASIIAFGLGYLNFAIVWLYIVRREYYCLWPGFIHRCWCEYSCLWLGFPQLCHRMAVRCMGRVLLPLAWVDSSLLSYGHMPYGASIAAFGLCYLIFAIHDCTSHGAGIIAFGLG